MGLGPLVSGLFADWRWSFWVQVIMCGILVAVFAIFFKETRGSVLLSQKAQALNQYYKECEQARRFSRERIRWKIQSNADRQPMARMLRASVCWPFCKSYTSVMALLIIRSDLLFTKPTLMLFALWLSFAWSILYLTFGSIPLLFTTSHHFTSQQSSAVFSSICVRSITSTLIAISRALLFKQPL